MERGLLGYVSCTYGRVRLDGISLRRTRAGRLALSFPARRDADGHNHPIIRPLDDSERRATMFLGPKCELVDAPFDEQRRIWEGII